MNAGTSRYCHAKLFTHSAMDLLEHISDVNCFAMEPIKPKFSNEFCFAVRFPQFPPLRNKHTYRA